MDMTIGRYDLWLWLGATAWPFWLFALGFLFRKLGKPAWSKMFFAAGGVLFLAIATTPLSMWLMRPLDNRYGTEINSQALTGIIVLAGAEQLAYSKHSGEPEFSEAAERIITGIALQREQPQARLYLVGGTHLRGGKRDIDYLRDVALRLGVPQDKAILVPDTWSTAQNVRAMAQMMQTHENWALVTSAFHMPRAMLCFERYGRIPLAVPVDHRTADGPRWYSGFGPSLVSNFKRFDDAMHEWIGLVAYRLHGDTLRLWPSVTSDQSHSRT